MIDSSMFIFTNCTGSAPPPSDGTKPQSINTPRAANPPFNRSNHNADIILRSSDSVEFYVHRVILSFASPVFETMFTLPQPPLPEAATLSVVDVTEDSSTLGIILRMCYPIYAPPASGMCLEKIHTVLRAASKYDIQAITARLVDLLEGFITNFPMRVYAIACLLHLERTARLAAKAVVLQDKTSGCYVYEFESMSMACYRRLLLYRKTRREIAGPGERRHRDCPNCPHSAKPIAVVDNPLLHTFCSSPAVATAQGPAAESKDPVSDALFLFGSHDADTSIMTADKVCIRIPRMILSLASSTLDDALTQSPKPVSSNSAADSLETCLTADSDDTNSTSFWQVDVDEHSQLIVRLLKLCDPSDHAELSGSPDDVLGLFRVALKYDVRKVLSMIRGRWSDIAAVDPLRFYIAAYQSGWKDEMQIAAKLSLHRSRQELEKADFPESEVVPAGPFYRLLEYHRNCGQAAVGVTLLSEPHALPAHKNCDTCHARWITSYLDSLKESLTDVPSEYPGKLDQVKMLEHVVRIALTCAKCNEIDGLRSILDYMQTFNLAQWVGEAIDKVFMQLDPPKIKKGKFGRRFVQGSTTSG